MDTLLRRMEALLERLRRTPPGPSLSVEMENTLDRWHTLLDTPEDAPPGEDEFRLTEQSLPGAEYQVWCDGSCAPNPGPGGWAAILQFENRRQELSGSSPQSTNNIMELTAAIEALRKTPPGARVTVTTDSRYVKDGITTWISGWKRKGWRKSDGDPVLNLPLWKALDALISERTVRFTWVRGHSGHPENERCDALANEARLSQ